MRQARMTAKAVLATVLVCGCGEESALIGPQSAARAVPGIGQNGVGSGALVTRSETTLEAFEVRGEGYTVVIGVSQAELARSCQTGEVVLDPATVLNVFRPDGSVHQVLRATEQNLLAWDEAPVNTCVTAPFASGSGQFTYTDNDLFGSFSRANSFGFRIHGEVTSHSTGERFRVLVRYHALFARPRNPVIKETSSELTLIPIGR